jgi:hypothetical protein
MSTTLFGGRMKVFSVGAKDAEVVPPANTFASVGTLGGK